MDRKNQSDRRFHPYPAVDKDNFRVYHQNDSAAEPTISRPSIEHRHSIYPTTPDNPYISRIVNTPKPQVALRYINVRGKQFKSLEAKRSGGHMDQAKKKKTTSAKESD